VAVTTTTAAVSSGWGLKVGVVGSPFAKMVAVKQRGYIKKKVRPATFPSFR
jgi:hypothetical protein